MNKKYIEKYQNIIDDQGFLLDPEYWSANFAIDSAKEFNLILTDKHWEIINIIRDLYEEKMIVPELRTTLKVLKNFNEEIATRKYIYMLFPYGYGQQACLIAGMRQPKKLWLDL